MLRPALALCSLLLVTASTTRAEEVPAGFTPLFNGKNLDGFEQYNGTATYRVEDGTIVGKTSEGSPNSFLCTKKHYGDFELRFEVKVDNALNSGVQIRSATEGGTPDGRVHGPQVEIATNGTAGSVWTEALGKGWINPDADRENEKKKAAFKKGEWNQYRVVAKGDHLQTWVNDVAITDCKDEKTEMRKGFLGLQVHGIKKGSGPYEVRWRNLFIKELD